MTNIATDRSTHASGGLKYEWGQHTAWAGTSDRSRLNFFMCTDIGLGEVSAGTAMAGISASLQFPLHPALPFLPFVHGPNKL